jgi:hypothetical protein
MINLKFVLYCFEWLSGLRINFHKSEAYTFGMEEEDSIRIANMLNCKLGVMPMTYLGITLSDSSLGMGALMGIYEKVDKRVPPWKGKHMPSGARLILSNRCLASLSTYTIGFYLLPLDIYSKMDGVRSRFYWRRASRDFKNHMIKWEVVCRPKDVGCLGVINTRIFNEGLIVNWIWKIYNQPDSLWVRHLKAKYMRSGELLSQKLGMGLSFGKVYIRLNIFLSGELFTRWEMV